MVDASARAEAQEAWSYERNLAELQVEVLERLVATTLVVAVIWLTQMGMSNVLPPVTVLALPPLLSATSLGAYWLCRRAGLRFGTVVYVLGIAGVVLLAVRAYDAPFTLVFLSLAVGAASVLASAAVGVAAAAIVSAALLMGGWLGWFNALPDLVVQATVVSVFSTAALFWVGLYPMRTTLNWAWRSYEREREQMEAARTSRGELSRALASLDVAYRRLETMNVELERAREAAVEARRLKAEFAANISHELRTPLNLIIGFSEMMIMSPQSYDDEPLPAAYRGDLQSIHRNAKHLSQLIDDVLDLSQVEAARMGLVREPARLADVVDEAIAAVAQIFKSKRLSLVSSVSPDLPQVEIDRTRVRQVLINLLNNAGRFTDSGGVTISAEVREDDVVVGVADTGIGISEEDLAKTFEEFRQLDGSIRRKAGGSGLGLAISRKLIELHGGRMWATSKLGEGTCFYFSLPLKQDITALPTRREWELAAHVGKPLQREQSVVVVASEQRTAGLFERYLDGYRVLSASSMEDAQRLCAQEPVRAVINTLTPGSTSWLDPGVVANGGSNVPMIAVALRGLNVTAQAMGVTRYLTKPVLQEHMTSVLNDLGPGVRNLLIVDDDHDTVRLLSRMARLVDRRYHITRAFDGRQALDSMNKRTPDAVILDLLMPDMDGYTVLERMRASPRLAGVPVVVATARGREQESISAEGLGLVRKDGFSIAEVMRCLKATLDAL